MASATQQTERKRQLKAKKAGTKRKKALAKNGTTPKFPVHQDK